MATQRYFYLGIIFIATSGAFAIYLNFQGFKCLTELSRLDRSVVQPDSVEEMERNCAITTNSYVYSIYGVVAGIIIVVIGFMKRRKDNAS